MDGSKTLYAWYKSMGICPQCGSNKSAPGRARCEECLAKNAESANKYRKSRKMNVDHSTYLKNLRTSRKQSGLCIDCGNPICSASTVYCIDCRIRNKVRNERRRNGIKRSERHEYGLCYICGEPTSGGKKLCNVCYKKACNNLPESKGGKNYGNWKQQNKLIFGDGGMK